MYIYWRCVGKKTEMKKLYDPIARFLVCFLAARLKGFLSDVEQSDQVYGRELRAYVLEMLSSDV
jgi:hypothetical protein